MEIHKVRVNDKDVFVSQRGDNFKVVKPLKNEDGSLNWFNILTGGSWRNIAIVGATVVIVLGLLYEYSINIAILTEQLTHCPKEIFGLT